MSTNSTATIPKMENKTTKLTHKLAPGNKIIVNRPLKTEDGSLKVMFERTLRVSDNGSVNNLPPGLGAFPVYKVCDYETTLPTTMSNKGGYFLPMHQREAMWIKFISQELFAVKVYVGGVNAVSGEPYKENGETMDRRYKLLTEKKNIQDYVVTPKQLWLDGVASTDGTVRQFVAMPLDSGYSIEAQITGADLIGGIQFDVTPVKESLSPARPIFTAPVSSPKPSGTPHFKILVRTLTGKSLYVTVSELHSVYELKTLIQDREGIPPDQQRLIFNGKQLNDDPTLGHYKIAEGAKLDLVLRLRGGGDPDTQMGVAAGGLIKQTILKDENSPTVWDPDNGTIFNVQILNSSSFKAVTGHVPPATPVTAKTYAKHGFPYFDIDEKPSGVKGDFTSVKSVAEKDLEGPQTLAKAKAIAEVIEDVHNPVVMLDASGSNVGFRPVKVMEQEVKERFGKLSI